MGSPKKDDQDLPEIDYQETEEIRGGGGEEEVVVKMGESSKTRKPRWSRREILLVIEGTHMVESLKFNNGGTKSKWESVSSFCNEHGVKRGPDHCRKRWGSLLIDFKKIKKWESLNSSFWTLTNVQRKENMLPCYFDREIYNLLETNLCVKPLNQVMMAAGEECSDDVHLSEMDQGVGKKRHGKWKDGFEERACKRSKLNEESNKEEIERKNDGNSEMIAAINRIGDAFVRIADKLQLHVSDF